MAKDGLAVLDSRAITLANLDPYSRLALALMRGAVIGLMSGDREVQILDLYWLLSEGVTLADLLPGDFDGDGVIRWIVSGLPWPVARRFDAVLRERIEGEKLTKVTPVER